MVKEVKVGIPPKLRVSKSRGIRIFQKMQPNSLTHDVQLGIRDDIKRKLDEKGYNDKNVFDEFTEEEKETKLDSVKEYCKKQKTKLLEKLDDEIMKHCESGVLNRRTENSSMIVSAPFTRIPLSSSSESNYESFLETTTGEVAKALDLKTLDDEVNFLLKHTTLESITEEDEEKVGGKVYIKFLRQGGMHGPSPTGLKNTVEQMQEYRKEERQSFAKERAERIKALVRSSSY